MRENKMEGKKAVETPKRDVDSKGKQVSQEDKGLSIEKKSQDGKKDLKDKKPEPADEAKEKKDGKQTGKEKPKAKKTEAVVNSFDLPISTIESAAICRFIKGKKIDLAIGDLEKVMSLKKAVPMKGELPHRRGKGMMSGRYPKKSAKHFIKVLKSLSGNAIANGVENPIVVEAVANIGQRQYGRFGSVRRKRTHLKIVAKSKPESIKK